MTVFWTVNSTQGFGAMSGDSFWSEVGEGWRSRVGVYITDWRARWEECGSVIR